MTIHVIQHDDRLIGYDIYDCFTMEHFRLRQKMTLTTKIYCSRLYIVAGSFKSGLSFLNWK
jgi:hypothetical protein